MGNETRYEYQYDGMLTKIKYPDGTFVQYGYDTKGNRTYEENENAHITRYWYNGFNQLKKIEDALGRSTIYTYDPNGNQTSITDRRGATTLFTYDALNRRILKEVPIESDGSVIEYGTMGYQYDSMGNLIQETASGTLNPTDCRVSNYTYYDNGLLDSVITNAGKSQTYYYDANGNTVKLEEAVVNGEIQVTRLVYDINNRMTQTIRLVDDDLIDNSESLPNIANLRDAEYAGKVMLVSGYQYDMMGKLTKEIDPRAYGYLDSDTANRDRYTTTYTYDSLGRLEKTISLFDGQQIYMQNFYDAKGNLIAQRDQKAGTVRYTYDLRGRMLTMTDQLLNVTTYQYDSVGNRVSATDMRDNTYEYEYDPLNRLVMITDPDNYVQQKNIYDEEGNVIKSIDARGYWTATSDEARYGTHYEYNLAGLLVKEIDPEVFDLGDATKFTAQYQYNQYGELIAETNGEGETTGYQYNHAGDLVGVTDALNIQTTYAYDLVGNMVTMIDGRQKQTVYEYGNFGILSNDTNSEGLQRSYTYDLALNPVSKIDRNGNYLTYAFDPRNLMTSKAVEETCDLVTWQYDELGNRIAMIDESGSYTYAYDSLSRLLNIQESGQQQIAYTYDEVGNILSVTDVNGLATTYTYDDLDRIHKVKYNLDSFWYRYDKNGNQTALYYSGPGDIWENEYDKNNRIVSVTHCAGDPSWYEYTYDLAGRVITESKVSGETSYTYDDVGRIIGVHDQKKNIAYQYDAAGNRSMMTETYFRSQETGHVNEATQTEIEFITKTSQYSYSDANKLMELTESWNDDQGVQVLQNTTSYTYDNNGNELTSGSGWMSTQSTYDGFDRLESKTSLKDGMATTVGFIYNGDDLRTERVATSTTAGPIPEITEFLYDRNRIILTMDDQGNNQERWVIGNQYERRYLEGGEIAFLMYNGHGDVVLTRNERRDIDNRYEYDAFGNLTREIEQYPCQIRYAGEYYDKDAELYYLRARHYNPSTGRFVSEDAYLGDYNDPLTLNLYTYCINNPLSYVDPSGHRAMLLGHEGTVIVRNQYDVYNEKREAEKASYRPPVQEVVEKSQVCIGELPSLYDNVGSIGRIESNNEVDKEVNSDTQINVFSNETIKKTNGYDSSGGSSHSNSGEKNKSVTESNENNGSSIKDDVHVYGNQNATFIDRIDEFLSDTRPIGDREIPTFEEFSGEILSNNKVTAYLGSMLEAMSDLEYKENNNYIVDTVVKILPEGNYDNFVKPFKSVAKVNTLIVGTSNLMNVTNTWTQDSGNSRLQRIEKTVIQISGASAAFVSGKATAKLVQVGLATAEATGGVSVGIGIIGAAYLDNKIADGIDLIQNRIYNYLDIK